MEYSYIGACGAEIRARVCGSYIIFQCQMGRGMDCPDLDGYPEELCYGCSLNNNLGEES